MDSIEKLYAGAIGAVIVTADGRIIENPGAANRVVLAGSFNPLHSGHRALLATAEELTGRRAYEISIENVDKPELPVTELTERLKAFKGTSDVFVTRARLFAQKSLALPGAWFVIGIDTAERLVDDRYYSDHNAMASLGSLESRGVKFVVAGRVNSDGKFIGADSLIAPSRFDEMFILIPEFQFREDVSSTELRARGDG